MPFRRFWVSSASKKPSTQFLRFPQKPYCHFAVFVPHEREKIIHCVVSHTLRSFSLFRKILLPFRRFCNSSGWKNCTLRHVETHTLHSFRSFPENVIAISPFLCLISILNDHHVHREFIPKSAVLLISFLQIKTFTHSTASKHIDLLKNLIAVSPFLGLINLKKTARCVVSRVTLYALLASLQRYCRFAVFMPHQNHDCREFILNCVLLLLSFLQIKKI